MTNQSVSPDTRRGKIHYDVFNGDADGIFALQQLRLAEPIPDAELITGVKRDIALLARPELATVANCSLTVLDISLDSNREPLLQLLKRDNLITYFDHHAATPIPENPGLHARIEFSAETCTSLLVNEHLQGKFPRWAICGAYGDNLHATAQFLADSCGLSKAETAHLREIGELFNYNGYGATITDLHFHPQDLYKAVAPYSEPLDFFHASPQMATLRKGHAEDMELVLSCKEYPNAGKNRVYLFPDTPWARRVAGVFANLKAREEINAAHAIITENSDSTLRISVRAPLNDRRDAATLCKQFPSGGGRAASAGINNMPASMLDDFLKAFNTLYS